MTISMIYRPNKTTSIYIRMTTKTIPLLGHRRRQQHLQRPCQRFASLFFLFKIFVASLRFSYEFAGLSQFNFQNWFNVLHCTTKIIRLFPFSLFFCRLKTQTTADLTDESSFVLHESGKLLVKPYIEELPELFVSYFKEILRVGYQIPRLEYYMSNGENVCVYSRNW